MILHALKLIWNRKRQNSLLLLELAGSFLVLLVLFTAALSTYSSWRQPVGFEATDLWTVSGRAEDPEQKPPEDLGARLLNAAREHPAVQEAGLMYFQLYTQSGLRTSAESPSGGLIFAENVPVSPGIGKAIGLELCEGRFFDEQDRFAHEAPIVMNRALADMVFGPGESAIDQTFQLGRHRVIGLVENFRKGGELAPEEPMFFSALWPDQSLRFGLATLALRMAPGASPESQEEIVKRLRAEMPQWSFDIERVEDQRQSHLEKGSSTLAAGAIIAVFLLLMVGLGVTGVLWQNISRRTPEIGLRRAQGATARDIRRQVGLELTVLTILSIALGGLLAAQIPLLDLVEVDLYLATQAFACATFMIILLTGACSLYPSWLASRIQPAQALHHS